MLTYTAPENNIGSLAQALRECEAMAKILSDPKDMATMCDNPLTVIGWCTMPPGNGVTVNIYWDTGRLEITAIEYFEETAS